MNIDPSQILIPALILSHLLVSVACGFIGYHMASRDSFAIIDDIQKRIDDLENPKERMVTIYDRQRSEPYQIPYRIWEKHKCANETRRRTKSAKS